MTGCRDIRPELGGYVLGALESDEAAAVRQHIDRCAKCANEHASLMELPDLLDLAQGIDAAAGPAPAVEERVLDSVARAPRARRRRPRALGWLSHPRRPLAMAAVGLACAAVGAGAAVPVAGDSGEQ
jgi:anti-sigma factor RsiW